jgi:hypothetical protein
VPAARAGSEAETAERPASLVEVAHGKQHVVDAGDLMSHGEASDASQGDV